MRLAQNRRDFPKIWSFAIKTKIRSGSNCEGRDLKNYRMPCTEMGVIIPSRLFWQFSHSLSLETAQVQSRSSNHSLFVCFCDDDLARVRTELIFQKLHRLILFLIRFYWKRNRLMKDFFLWISSQVCCGLCMGTGASHGIFWQDSS